MIRLLTEFLLWHNGISGVLGSAGTQVQSPAWHNGLRIWHCRSCGLGPNCGLDLIPGPGTPYAVGPPPPQKKKTAHKYSFSLTNFPTSIGFPISEKLGWMYTCPHILQLSPLDFCMQWWHVFPKGKIPSLLILSIEAQAFWAIQHHSDSLLGPSNVHVLTLYHHQTSSNFHLLLWIALDPCAPPASTSLTSVLSDGGFYSFASYTSGHWHRIDVFLVTCYPLEITCLPSSFKPQIF